MRRLQYSGRNVVVTVGGVPLRGLAKIEDAVVAEYTESDFSDPAMDMSGDGQHVENVGINVMITIKLASSSTSFTYLNGIRTAKQAVPNVTVRDIGTPNANAVAVDAVMQDPAKFERGHAARQPGVYVFKGISGVVNEDGAIVIPV